MLLTWGIILRCGGLGSNIPDLYSLDTSSTPSPSCDKEKCLQTWPNVPGGWLWWVERRLVEQLWSNVSIHADPGLCGWPRLPRACSLPGPHAAATLDVSQNASAMTGPFPLQVLLPRFLSLEHPLFSYLSTPTHTGTPLT